MTCCKGGYVVWWPQNLSYLFNATMTFTDVTWHCFACLLVFHLSFSFSNLGGSFTLNFNMNIILHSEIFPTFTFGYCFFLN